MCNATVSDPDGGDEAREVLLQIGEVTVVEGGDGRFEDGGGDVFANCGIGGVVGG